jgi:hypothetical protein
MIDGILATFLMVEFSLLRGRDPSREWVKSQSPAEGSRR